MGEEGSFGLELLGDGDGFVEAVVGDVWLVAEGVEDEGVEAFELVEAVGGDVVGVGAVGDVADAEAKDFETRAVKQADRFDLRAEDVEGIGGDAIEGQTRDGSFVSLLVRREGIIERVSKTTLDSFFTIKWQRRIEIELKESQVVEAEDVVGVLVCESDCVNDADSLAKQLLPQVGRGVDEQVACG